MPADRFASVMGDTRGRDSDEFSFTESRTAWRVRRRPGELVEFFSSQPGRPGTERSWGTRPGAVLLRADGMAGNLYFYDADAPPGPLISPAGKQRVIDWLVGRGS